MVRAVAGVLGGSSPKALGAGARPPTPRPPPPRPLRLLTRAPQVLAADLDLLNPPADYEKRKHKLKRLVQSPNSFFMDVKCQASSPAPWAAALTLWR